MNLINKMTLGIIGKETEFVAECLMKLRTWWQE